MLLPSRLYTEKFSFILLNSSFLLFFLVLFRVAAGQDISAIPNCRENHFPSAPFKLDDSVTLSEGPNSTNSLGNHTSWDSLPISPLYLPWPV